MSKTDDDLGSEWDDEPATTVYQDGMLDQARAALEKQRAGRHADDEPEDETWFISKDGEQKQSLSAAEVIERCRSGQLSEETLVWHEGLDGWTKLVEVPELKRIVGVLKDASRPRNDKPALPPLPKPPPASKPAAAPAAEGQAAAEQATVAPSKKPTPLAPRFDSEPTRVYDGNSAEMLQRQLVPSDRARQAASSAPPSDRLPAAPPAAAANLLAAAAADEAPAGSRKGRVLGLAVAFVASLAVGAFAFQGQSDAAAPAPVQYDLDLLPSGVQHAGAARAAQPAEDGSEANDEGQAQAQPVQDESAAADSEPAPAASEPVPAAESEADIAEAMARALRGRSGEVVSAGGFDEVAARRAMASAAKRAENCRPRGGPRGTGSVRVRIEPSGQVASATVLTKKFAGNQTGSCIAMVFRQASVPPFKGGAKTVDQRFTIPD